MKSAIITVIICLTIITLTYITVNPDVKLSQDVSKVMKAQVIASGIFKSLVATDEQLKETISAFVNNEKIVRAMAIQNTKDIATIDAMLREMQEQGDVVEPVQP